MRSPLYGQAQITLPINAKTVSLRGPWPSVRDAWTRRFPIGAGKAIVPKPGMPPPCPITGTPRGVRHPAPVRSLGDEVALQTAGSPFDLPAGERGDHLLATDGAGAELAHEALDGRRGLQDLIRPQRLDPGGLLRHRPRVDLVLLHPVPQRLAGADAELVCHRLQGGRLVRVVVAHLGNHARSTAAELKGVTGRFVP
jgi:hypothetical protein